MTCQGGLHSPQAAQYFGHPSLALTILAPSLSSLLCRQRFTYGTGKPIGSLDCNVFPDRPTY
jgi:hypothetical protein